MQDFANLLVSLSRVVHHRRASHRRVGRHLYHLIPIRFQSYPVGCHRRHLRQSMDRHQYHLRHRNLTWVRKKHHLRHHLEQRLTGVLQLHRRSRRLRELEDRLHQTQHHLLHRRGLRHRRFLQPPTREVHLPLSLLMPARWIRCLCYLLARWEPACWLADPMELV